MTYSSLSLFLLLLVLLNRQPFLVEASNIKNICKAAASTSPNINLNFCITSLQSTSGSVSADMKGLAVIAANLAATSASTTKSNIQELLTKTSDSNMRSSLRICLELYSDAIPNVSASVNAIKSSRYSDAKTFLSAAFDAPADCEDAFLEIGVEKLPIEKGNGDFKQLSAIALAITNAL